MESAFRLLPISRFSFQIRAHLVNTYGCGERPSSARATTSSECPSPYTAAVSIQLMPASRAAWIAAIDSASSCGPHENAQPFPPIAQAPIPRRVISISLLPSRFLSIDPPISSYLLYQDRRIPETFRTHTLLALRPVKDPLVAPLIAVAAGILLSHLV